MGEVWSALDLRLHRSVAVKLLGPQIASDAGVRQRFEGEARAAARLNHPNVVAVYDSGEHEGTPYLVMELLPGRTLADELAEGPVEPGRARRLGVQILDALAASHEAGVLHRDIKPGNVLLAADGSAKVGDFGIAKSTEGLNLTSTGMIVGTAGYLAPERLAGDPATPRTDLYSVGVVLYEALSGHKPFEADTPMGLLRAVDEHRPVPLAEARPGLDPVLAATVERAMAKDSAHRFGSAREMASALGGQGAPGVAAAATTVATPAAPRTDVLPSSPPPSSPPVGDHDGGDGGDRPAAGRTPSAGRNPAVLVASFLVPVLMMIVVVLLVTRDDDPPSTSDGTSVTTSATSGGSLPDDLDRAITELEEAVRP